jgi:murein L,D-transpeptidase YafK
VLALLGTCSALAEDRVAQVRKARGAEVEALVRSAQVAWPVGELYLRAFKKEQQLEVWGGEPGKPLTLIKRYPICAASGVLGPKRKEGDLQVPEGLYTLGRFNPTSSYHLSLEITYPNTSDRVLSDPKHPGGLIYLHGNCVSIGCIAIEDGPIEEVYLMALEARSRPIPIHIFPFRFAGAPLEPGPNAAFWKQLEPAYTAFEATHRPPIAKVDAKTGAYAVSQGK